MSESIPTNNSLRNWLYALPCVRERRVIVDVRGPWPTAIIDMKAQQVESRETFINFIIENLS